MGNVREPTAGAAAQDQLLLQQQQHSLPALTLEPHVEWVELELVNRTNARLMIWKFKENAADPTAGAAAQDQLQFSQHACTLEPCVEITMLGSATCTAAPQDSMRSPESALEQTVDVAALLQDEYMYEE
ncbi:unnamed protein product [Meganyctiphanes norvegica]|uniref:Uncharacterized protein n=1 Tax=Meganyctiphanes norvegica TaxID=48144 RepID=A0AAV2QRQ3_MEGNR